MCDPHMQDDSSIMSGRAMTKQRKTIVIAVLVASIHGLIAWITNSHRFFFGAFGPYSVTGMVELFFDYANRALDGAVPYRDYLVEYPVLAFVLFLIPRLVVSNFAGYRVVFGVELLLFNALAVVVVARHVVRVEGFDRLPAARLVHGVLCQPLSTLDGAVRSGADGGRVRGGRPLVQGEECPGRGYGWARGSPQGLPWCGRPPALVWELSRLRESRGRGTAAFLGTIVLGVAAWVVLGRWRFVDSFLYHTRRRTSGGIALCGNPHALREGNQAAGQMGLSPQCAAPLAGMGRHDRALTLPIQAVAILLAVWCFRRSGMKDGVRYAGAAVLAFLVFGNVLSPQFLIWLIPFVTVLGGSLGRRARWMYLLACMATTFLYPLIGLKLILDYNSLEAIILLNYRNALLVGLYLLLLFGREPAAGGPECRAPMPVGSEGIGIHESA